MQLNLLKKKPADVEQILSSFYNAIDDLDDFAATQKTEAAILDEEAEKLKALAGQSELDAKGLRTKASRAEQIRSKLYNLISEV